jgi:hypothetical protein
MTYGGNKEERSVLAGKLRSGYACAPFPRQNAEFLRCNNCKQINILKNQNQIKNCVNLHQIKGEKYTLTKVIFCLTNGECLTDLARLPLSHSHLPIER